MKIALFIVAAITIIMFVAITNESKDCSNVGGEYIQTNSGGICVDKEMLLK